MSRFYNHIAQDYSYNDVTIVSGAPLTMSCWMYITDFSPNTTAVCLGYLGGADGQLALKIPNITNSVRANKQDILGNSNTQTDASGQLPYQQWCHGLVVFGTGYNFAYWGGSNKGLTNNEVNDPTIQTIAIGAQKRASVNQYFAGAIAEAAVWNVSLTDSEQVQLSQGLRPSQVRPQNLVAYWPLSGVQDPEPDVINGYDLTLVGTVGSGHPQMFNDLPDVSYNIFHSSIFK